MPELPEVESIRKQLEKYLVGHRIEKVEVRDRKIFPDDEKKVVGGKVEKVRRFGKVVVVGLDNDYSIIGHVKLTGQFVYRGPKLKDPPELSGKVTGGLGGRHTRVVFVLDREGKLYYNDVRKFGWIKIVKSGELRAKNEFISKLGPEPFKDLTLKKFKEICGDTRGAIKVVLMDQGKIGGIGNIYANDALWLAKIDPRTPANKLTGEQVKDLYRAVEKVLRQGLKYGGASELSFVTPDGTEGEYQRHFLVYGQQGKLCKRCRRDKIKKVVLGGRGTYYCATCQDW